MKLRRARAPRNSAWSAQRGRTRTGRMPRGCRNGCSCRVRWITRNIRSRARTAWCGHRRNDQRVRAVDARQALVERGRRVDQLDVRDPGQGRAFRDERQTAGEDPILTAEVAHDVGQALLGIQVAQQDALPGPRQLAAEIPGRRRLADPTLAVRQADAEVRTLDVPRQMWTQCVFCSPNHRHKRGHTSPQHTSAPRYVAVHPQHIRTTTTKGRRAWRDRLGAAATWSPGDDRHSLSCANARKDPLAPSRLDGSG